MAMSLAHDHLPLLQHWPLPVVTGSPHFVYCSANKNQIFLKRDFYLLSGEVGKFMTKLIRIGT
jgi:hypothetical protein